MDRVGALRTAIRQTAAENGAEAIRVFGSVARGDDVPTSDVDFLVALKPGRTMLDLARLEIRLEAMLGRRVDVVTEASLREPARSAALREAIDV
jgi:uncharacterized protein